MASALYDKGREKFLSGDIDWVNDTIRVAFLGSGYTANMATDEFFGPLVTALIGTPIELTSKTATAGVADAADVTSGNIGAGSTITQIVIYKYTGDANTSPLIAREDVASTPTNGGTITLSWDSGANKIFKL
jgi:hypothetical protein